MKRSFLALCLMLLLAAPALAGECALPPGGQCSLAMDPAATPVEVVNLDQEKGGTVQGYWLYSEGSSPRQVTAGLKPGEALIFSPPRGKDSEGNTFPARTLVLYNLGNTPLSARTVK